MHQTMKMIRPIMNNQPNMSPTAIPVKANAPKTQPKKSRMTWINSHRSGMIRIKRKIPISILNKSNMIVLFFLLQR